MINGIAHVAMVVSDLEKSINFYRDLLGFSSVWFRERPEGIKIALLARPGHDTGGQYEVELLSFPSSTTLPAETRASNVVGLRHVALLVDNIDEVYANLHSKGVTFTREPVILGPGLPKLCQMIDPDGIPIELVQFVTEE